MQTRISLLSEKFLQNPLTTNQSHTFICLHLLPNLVVPLTPTLTKCRWHRHCLTVRRHSSKNLLKWSYYYPGHTKLGSSATGRPRRVAKMIKVECLCHCVAFVYTRTLTHWHSLTHSLTHAHPPTHTQAHTPTHNGTQWRTHARAQSQWLTWLTHARIHARTHAHHAAQWQHTSILMQHLKTQSETSEISVSLPPRNAARS